MSIRDTVARHSNFDDTKDFIPTPPFATRALYRYVLPELAEAAQDLSIWDPAAGEGHMTQVFREYGHPIVRATDKYDYGDHMGRMDFTNETDLQKALLYTQGIGVLCTNPPYKELMTFIKHGMECSNKYLCLLVRIQALTGQARFKRFYDQRPPTRIGIFADRVPFKVGQVVRKCSKMFDHMWMVWDMDEVWGTTTRPTELTWIPPTAQQELEKESDYV